MKKSTVYAIIAFIIILVNIMIVRIPLIMLVALGVAITSVYYSIKEKKDRMEEL